MGGRGGKWEVLTGNSAPYTYTIPTYGGENNTEHIQKFIKKKRQ
jgi:hypothetical protein